MAKVTKLKVGDWAVIVETKKEVRIIKVEKKSATCSWKDEEGNTQTGTYLLDKLAPTNNILWKQSKMG